MTVALWNHSLAETCRVLGQSSHRPPTPPRYLQSDRRRGGGTSCRWACRREVRVAGREPQGPQGCLGRHPHCSGHQACPCGQPSSQATSPSWRPCTPRRCSARRPDHEGLGACPCASGDYLGDQKPLPRDTTHCGGGSRIRMPGLSALSASPARMPVPALEIFT